MTYRHLVAILCAVLSATSACAGRWRAGGGQPVQPRQVDGRTVFRSPHARDLGQLRGTRHAGRGRIRRALQDRSLRNLEVSTAEGETGTTTNVLLGETIPSVSDDDARREPGAPGAGPVLCAGTAARHHESPAPLLLPDDSPSTWSSSCWPRPPSSAAWGWQPFSHASTARSMPRSTCPSCGVSSPRPRARLARDLLRTLARESLAPGHCLTYAYVTACLRLLPWTKETTTSSLLTSWRQW